MTLTTLVSLMANHLWQSTLFALAAAVVVLVLRNHHARTRYWVWWIASVKFLIPFSLLVSVGSLFSWRVSSEPPVEPSLPSVVIVQVAEPFTTNPVGIVGDGSGPAPQEAIESTLPALLVATWLCGSGLLFLRWASRWKRARAVLRNSSTHRVEFITEGRELATLRHLERRLATRKPLAMVRSRVAIEPSVFGILRQVLAWPVDLSERLGEKELEAILLHELAHARRRDNMTAALHMVVEAVFWFHPLVWWVGTRLVDEREKACDEAVLRFGGESQVYAEGILKVCEFCLETPLACAAGVTGSDLKRRIEEIMQNRVARRLGFSAAVVLLSAAMATFVAPLAIGVLQTAQIHAAPVIPVPIAPPEFRPEPPKLEIATPMTPVRAPMLPQPVAQTRDVFDVISIRPATGVPVGGARGGGPGLRGGGPAGPQPCGGLVQLNPGRFVASNVTLYRLITMAYGKNCRLSQEQELLARGPDWRQSVAFDIQATLPAGAPAYTVQQLQNGEAPRLQMMLQNMLADRFSLTLHRETKEIPVYNLVVVKMGRIKLSDDQTPPPPLNLGGVPPPPPPPPPPGARGDGLPRLEDLPRGAYGVGVDPPAGMVTIWGRAIPISTMINFIQGGVGRMVVDKTEPKGLYDIERVTLDVGPFDIGPGSVTVWPEIMNQLGLRMDPTRGPAEVLVIDRAEKPSEN